MASSWGPLAVAALMQLWDRQLSFAGHAQLMFVMTEHLNCLQVPIVLPIANSLPLFCVEFCLESKELGHVFLDCTTRAA